MAYMEDLEALVAVCTCTRTHTCTCRFGEKPSARWRLLWRHLSPHSLYQSGTRIPPLFYMQSACAAYNTIHLCINADVCNSNFQQSHVCQPVCVCVWLLGGVCGMEPWIYACACDVPFWIIMRAHACIYATSRALVLILGPGIFLCHFGCMHELTRHIITLAAATSP
jgi:hypothetical protein